MPALDAIDPIKLGDRLRAARASARKTQEQAASAIGIGRPTLVAIEKGERRVRMSELVALAEVYGTSANALLHQARPIPEFTPQFRRTMGKESDEAASIDAVRLLERLAAAYASLSRMLGQTSQANYPPPLKLVRGQVYEQAEDAALAVRSALGVGLSPIPDLSALLDGEWYFRIFVRSLESRISGVYAYSAELGPCVLLNAKHPFGRRQNTLAHELGHFVSTREAVEVAVLDSSTDDSPGEKFASRFGPAFLMPGPALRRRYNEITATDQFSVRHLIFLAHAFHVTNEGMCRRLEGLRLVHSGTWDMLRERGFRDEHVKPVLGPQAEFSGRSGPTRLDLMASEAYERRLVSEGQLASMLDLDRIGVRELLDTLAADGEEGANAP